MKTDPKQLALEKQRLPQYPRTPHLPHKPNMSEDDVSITYLDVDAFRFFIRPCCWKIGVLFKLCVSILEQKITHRFKMVREDFQRGVLWDAKQLKKNTCVK